MKKPLLLLVLLGFPVVSAYFIYPFALRAVFLVQGTAQITSDLAERAARPNTMLFLVARNEDGVPVAVKKVINPVFPLDFQMTPADLIMPDILTKTVYLEAFLNNHGQLGVLKSGDLTGLVKKPVFIFTKHHVITIDTPAK
jgi:hypothetical protein